MIVHSAQATRRAAWTYMECAWPLSMSASWAARRSLTSVGIEATSAAMCGNSDHSGPHSTVACGTTPYESKDEVGEVSDGA